MAPVEDTVLTDLDYYVERGYPHDAWTQMRAEAPVLYCARYEVPYWAITRHEDIVSISRRPDRFISGPRFQLQPGTDEDSTPHEVPRTIISMDPPEHRAFRQLISRRFTPRRLRGMERDLERIAEEIVRGFGEDGSEGECDFVERVAAPLPIAIIAWLLGVPEGDWPLLYRLTNETIGAADPEYGRPGETASQTRERAFAETFGYFKDLLEERRRQPGDDLVSELAVAEIDGRRLAEGDLLAYYLILVAAGNETTRNATTGGLLAFIEHPEEWARLRKDESLLPSAVEEILRWTSPIIQMARTATEDVEIRGQTIRAGDTVALFYPSANRDETIFDEPFRYRIDRTPNRHLAFGVGEHFCVGSHLARMELLVAFRHVARRLDEVELAGPVERLRSGAVGGVKHLPIRYRLSTHDSAR